MSSDVSSELLEQQIRETTFDNLPPISSSRHQHEPKEYNEPMASGFAPGESMSPSDLDADFAELQASKLISDAVDDGGDRSQMYETGEQSDAIKSAISRTYESPLKESNGAVEMEISSSEAR